MRGSRCVLHHKVQQILMFCWCPTVTSKTQSCFGQALDAGSKAKAVWHVQGDKVVAHLLAGAAFGELALMQVRICVERQPPIQSNITVIIVML